MTLPYDFSSIMRGIGENVGDGLKAIATAIAGRPDPVTYNIVINTSKEFSPEVIAKAVKRAIDTTRPNYGPDL